jgi:hypothetical protein
MRAPACLLLCATLAAAGCGPTVDLSKGLQVQLVSSGWFDAGIVDGKNKIVPSVTFKLRKKPEADLSGVALNIAFSRSPDPTASRRARRPGR